MPSYAEQEREWRDEHLNWLHEQHETLLEQTQVMRQQSYTLQRMARHTGLIYAVMIVWIAVIVVAFFAGVIAAAAGVG